jgi:hypothetical protein
MASGWMAMENPLRREEARERSRKIMAGLVLLVEKRTVRGPLLMSRLTGKRGVLISA